MPNLTANLLCSTEEATDVNTSPEQLKHLGSITLSIQRMMRQKRAVPVKSRMEAYDGIGIVSEKVLKGQAISNSVRYVITLHLALMCHPWMF